MSHFCVAVATKTKDISEIEKLLEPYWEEKEVEPYIRRTKADIIEDARKWKADFEAELKENPEKEMFEWQQKYLNANTDEELYKLQKEEDELYDEDGNELTTYNPNSKWDWCSIGGRYDKCLIVDKDNEDTYDNGEIGLFGGISDGEVEGHPELKRTNGAKIKDIKFNMMGGNYEKAIREWELIVEGQESKNEAEAEVIKWNLYKPEYYIEQYGTKEEYARQESMFMTWAFVNEQGWCEQGEMGWWAMNDATKDSRLAFAEKLNEYISSPEHQEEYLFIVDCHI